MYARAHKISAEDQVSSSEIIEFVMTLQPFLQDKLLKKIDGDRPPRSLQEAYNQALDLEQKNQIRKRYESLAQISQISEYISEGDFKEIDVIEYSVEAIEVTEILVQQLEIVLSEEVKMVIKTEDRILEITLEVLEEEI